MKHIIYILTCVLVWGCKPDEGPNPYVTGNVNQPGNYKRFALSGNLLCCTSREEVHLYDISSPAMPAKINIIKNEDPLARYEAIQSVYITGNLLLVSSFSSSKSYVITDPFNVRTGITNYFMTSCDLADSDSNYMYSTVRSENTLCNRNYSLLRILSPISSSGVFNMITSVPLYQPYGVAIHKNLLWVCDSGLKVMNVQNIQQPQLLAYTPTQARKVMIADSTAITLTKGLLEQWRLNQNQLTRISTLE